MQMGAEASQQGALLTFAALISINRKDLAHYTSCLHRPFSPRLMMLLPILLLLAARAR